MAMSQRAKGLLAGVLALAAAIPSSAAPPSVDDMLAFKPYQKGVLYSTPAASEKAACKVELVQGASKGASGWVLRDPNGRLLRKFFDNNGDKYPDQWSYYKDGVEVYRELDTNFNGARDTYVWLNSGGMKIGLDRDEKDGIIDYWQALSIEELSQEVVKALATKDVRILQPLLASEEELKAIGLPAADVARIATAQKQLQAKFQALCTKMSHINEGTQWLHTETSAPARIPSDATGGKRDILWHSRAMLVCETAGKADVLQLGELVLIGEAWKLLDVPGPGEQEVVVGDPAGASKTAPPGDPMVQEILKRIAELDKAAPSYVGVGVNPAVAAYHLQRADMLEQILGRVPAAEAGPWVRQLADSLSTAVQASPASDSRAFDRLVKLAEKTAKEGPGSDLAAYVSFRELTSDYSRAVQEARNAKAMVDAQGRHVERLARFVAAYPKAEETADALLQLGMIHEFQGKEADAQRWYEQLVRTHASAPQAAKAAGALRRIHLEGKPWELGGPVVSLNGSPWTVDRIRGKPAVIYYWAEWCQSAAADWHHSAQ